jgi:PAS domain S-box-containing protein
VTSWNSGAARIFGYSAEEMVDQPISVLAPPDRKNEMTSILERIARGERVEHFRSVRRTKAGKDLQVSITVSPVRDENGKIFGASKILRDITAQFEAEKETALQRERLHVTLRSIGDAVLATDTDGRIAYLNPVAEKLTGWPYEQAMGRLLEEVLRIINEETRKPAENPVAKVFREGTVVGLANHTVLISRQGTEIAIEDSAAPIRDDQGELKGVVLVFHDATMERKTQDMLRKAERLAAAARLSASVAHEINNPLASVMYLIYMAKTAPDTPPAMSSISRLRSRRSSA